MASVARFSGPDAKRVARCPKSDVIYTQPVQFEASPLAEISSRDKPLMSLTCYRCSRMEDQATGFLLEVEGQSPSFPLIFLTFLP